MKLDQAFIERIREPMRRSWNVIGSEAYGEMERVSNYDAVEAAVDADHLKIHGGDAEADALVMQACKEHGWNKVLPFLVKNVILEG